MKKKVLSALLAAGVLVLGGCAPKETEEKDKVTEDSNVDMDFGVDVEEDAE